MNRFMFTPWAGLALAAVLWIGPVGPTPAALARPEGARTGGVFEIDFAISPDWTPSQRVSLRRALAEAAAGPKPASVLEIAAPSPGSLFPLDMVAPTFFFHDPDPASSLWLVEASSAGEADRIFVLTDGRLVPEEIDPRCGTHQGEDPAADSALTVRSWTPTDGLWRRITAVPEKDVVITVNGFAGPSGTKPPDRIALLSRGAVTVRVSRDPVGAPIFYRDVPLMPTSNDQGVIKPLADGALPLVEWRLRDLSRPRSRIVLKDMPTCANCHSFSQDGRVLGMDMDGPSGDKGAYALAPVAPRLVIGKEMMFSWNAIDPGRGTFGLFSRVSPDGRFVVSSVKESLFVTNYLDYRFLQTFYPTRGLLAVYSRATGAIALLPGADDPAYVQANPVWTPDGRTIVFLRAPAINSVPTGPRPVKANDPDEIQIKYDLTTIPFNDGRGGVATPLPGASANGKSNSFPQVSPDGRWIVWVQAANGLLMRPDSELFIMSLSGGTPRRMTCNLSPMNSWHSWSPNSRWLVFSSKAGTPYTRMFLTHIDEGGNDSPAVLIPHSTAANRAVNLPEFAAIEPGGLLSIEAPAVDYRRHVDRGLALIKARDFEAALEELKTAEEMKPDIPEALAAIGLCCREKGDVGQAIEYFEKALAIDPRHWPARNLYGVTLFRQGRHEEAMRHFAAALEIYPLDAVSRANTLSNMGAVEYARGNDARAGEYLERAVVAAPDFPEALSQLAWLYATGPDDAFRDGRRALELALRLRDLSKNPATRVYDILAAAYAEAGQFGLAVQAAEESLKRTPDEDPAAANRRRFLELYRSGRPYRAPRR